MVVFLIGGLALLILITSIFLVAVVIDRIDQVLVQLERDREDDESDEQQSHRLRIEKRNYEIFTGPYSYP